MKNALTIAAAAIAMVSTPGIAQDAIVDMTKSALREVGPLLTTITNAAVQCGVDTIMLNIKKVGPARIVEPLQTLPCFNAMLDQVQRNGYQKLTV